MQYYRTMIEDAGCKLQKYKAYLQLSSLQKRLRIYTARREKEESPNPQGNHQFTNSDFVALQVNEEGKKIKLVTFRYACKGKAKAVVIMFHGLNSHTQHGAHIAHDLAEAGIETVGFDHRGFGQSQGIPGYVQDLEQHLGDCLAFLELIRPLYQELPIFCLGKSMGGLSSYHLTLRHRDLFAGAILMAPAIKNQLGRMAVCLSSCLQAILPRQTRLTRPIYNRSNRNPAVVKFIDKDPFAYKGRGCLSTMNFLLQAMDQTPATFKDYNCPFIVVQGGRDKAVDPMGAFQLFMQSPLDESDKQILFYEHMWHDIWHEPQIGEITGQIIKWINGRLEKDSQSGISNSMLRKDNLREDLQEQQTLLINH